jgi:hypothetical protein
MPSGNGIVNDRQRLQRRVASLGFAGQGKEKPSLLHAGHETSTPALRSAPDVKIALWEWNFDAGLAVLSRLRN